MNASDKGTVLCSLLSDPNLVGLARNPGRADIDVVTAGREVDPGTRPQGDVDEPLLLFASASKPSAMLS